MKITPDEIKKKLVSKKQALAAQFSLTRLLWLKGREYKGDSNNNPALVAKGFKGRLEESSQDDALLNRIVTAYKKSKTGQQNAGASYQVSNEWLPIYEYNLREVLKALQSEDTLKLGQLYRNFMRNACSAGLVGLPIDMEKHFFRGKISSRNRRRFLYDNLHRYKLWQSLLAHAYGPEVLASPDIGNPYGYFIDSKFIKVGADYLHYYATVIGRLARSRGHRIVVELGGGYGGMAFFLLRDQRDLSYADFDLPENMALTAYYLLKAFPEKTVLLYGEADLTLEAVRSHDIVLMPSFELPKLPDGCADVSFNSYSLAEMSPEAVHTYVTELCRVTKGYFLHVNHNRVSVVRADDFGVDPAQYDMLYRIPALWNGGRNLQMDEYEYLYKKIETQEAPAGTA